MGARWGFGLVCLKNGVGDRKGVVVTKLYILSYFALISALPHQQCYTQVEFH
jgi:hypothetical protein